MKGSEDFGLKQFQNKDLPNTKEDETIVLMYGMAPSSQFWKMLAYFFGIALEKWGWSNLGLGS